MTGCETSASAKPNESLTMRIVYNVLFPILFLISAPYYLLRMCRRGGWRAGFAQRFGNYDNVLDSSFTDGQVFWLHAVSVGEINVCVELVRALELLRPSLKFVVSTTTTTGMEELRKKLPSHVAKIYYPVDGRGAVRRALKTIKPKAIILVEAEIWPNLIWQAGDLKIPLFLINARLSDRSYPGYLRFGILFKELFGSFTAVGAQTEEYAVKLKAVGCQPDGVAVSGNLKFDIVKLDVEKASEIQNMLARLGMEPDSMLLVAGSTHDGEELILAKQYLRLRQRFPKLFLVLVPRHFERAQKVGRILTQCGVKFAFRSGVMPDTRLERGAIDCLVVNTTGELVSFYAHATVAFVGKSITANGGQNPIEPAALGKATVFGPNMQNFGDVARIFVSHGGAIQVNNSGELEAALGELLADRLRREKLGKMAEQIVRENKGATLRTATMILERCKMP
jgi:3-deoxy-D-manno-octulosonic-acid transferase